MRKILALITFVAFGLPAYAQPPAAKPLLISAFLQDPTKPNIKLFIKGKDEKLGPLNLVPGSLSKAQETIAVGGTFTLFSSAAVDPQNPAASLAGSVTVPAGINQAFAIIVPSPAGKTPPYQIVLIDRSPATFKSRESRILALTNLELATQVGEHKLPILPGKITPVPPVVKVDAFNMAQTNFYFKKEGQYTSLNESRIKFLNDQRQLFIIGMRANGNPTLTTLIDDSLFRQQPAKPQ
jgi:hypothetical protein